jgi:hypothetical protein
MDKQFINIQKDNDQNKENVENINLSSLPSEKFLIKNQDYF